MKTLLAILFFLAFGWLIILMILPGVFMTLAILVALLVTLGKWVIFFVLAYYGYRALLYVWK